MTPRKTQRHGAGSLRRRFGSAALGTVALLALSATTTAAIAADVGPLTRVTGQSPFSGCTADDVAGQTGVNYPNTEIEPWLAANPANPRNLLVGVQQDRWSNGGARGNSGAYSRDGGRTWKRVVPPGVSLCSGGRYQRASDPWVDFSPNGTAYFMSLVTDNDPPSGAFGKNGMVVNRSTDGGATWSRPIQLSALPVGQSLDDKNSLTADPTNPNFVYAVWDRLTDFTLPPELRGGGAPGARARAKWLAEGKARREAVEVFFTGPAFLARTTNGGRSWEAPRKIFDPGPNAQTIANQIVVTPDGGVYDFFTHVYSNGGTRLEFVKSTDKGRTFGRSRRVATITTVNGVVTPDTQELVRDASILFDVAVDRRNGNLYAVWQDVRFGGVDAVAFSQSTDGGATWSSPVRINKTPTGVAFLRRQAFIPSVEVASNGTVVVTHYDFRNDKGSGGELTDHWAVLCSAGCERAGNWGGELRLTARSFDYLDAPVARGYFLGDYMGLARAGDAVYSAFGVPVGEDLTNIFTRRITFGAAGAVASLAD